MRKIKIILPALLIFLLCSCSVKLSDSYRLKDIYIPSLTYICGDRKLLEVEDITSSGPLYEIKLKFTYSSVTPDEREKYRKYLLEQDFIESEKVFYKKASERKFIEVSADGNCVTAALGNY